MGNVSFKNEQLDINHELVFLQKLTLIKLSNLFIDNKIRNLKLDYLQGLGVRGKYDNLINIQLEIYFYYTNYYFEFYLSYDQLEYYIYKENILVAQCNLEDFWEESIMTDYFLFYLQRDLKKNEILFNEIKVQEPINIWDRWKNSMKKWFVIK